MSFLSNLFGGSNNYTVTTPTGGTPYVDQTSTLQPAIQTAQGNYNTSNAGLNTLASQLQAQSQGAGPNLANAQLQAATGQNIAQGAGQIDSIKGISPALAASQVANQTATANQVAGQNAATNRLQQQLSSQGLLGQTLGTQGILANQFNQIGQTALTNQNAQVAQTGEAASAANGQIAGSNASNNLGVAGSVLNGAGALGSSAGLFGSGAQRAQTAGNLFAKGGEVENPKIAAVAPEDRFAHNLLPDHLKAVSVIYHGHPNSVKMADGGVIRNTTKIPPLALLKGGGTIPGKPKYNGNDYRNDIVNARLSKGEIVIPNSITQASDAPEKARDFVARELAKHKSYSQDDFKGAISRGIKARKAQ